ncbi:MAG: family 16 glycoside hydrolase [Chloroflexia bacterium]
MAALLLVAIAAVIVAGASQAANQQVPPATIALAPPQAGDNGRPGMANAPALPPATGAVTFSDSFDGTSLSGWHNLREAAGTWQAQDGRLQPWGNEAGDLANDQIALVTNYSDFRDGVFEAMVNPTSGEGVGLLFRGSDAGYYRLILSPNLPNSGPRATLERVGAGGGQIAANSSWQGFDLGQWLHVQVKTAGDHITASVDGTQLFDATDANLASGWVGVWTIADRGSQFDNVRVQSGAAGR